MMTENETYDENVYADDLELLRDLSEYIVACKKQIESRQLLVEQGYDTYRAYCRMGSYDHNIHRSHSIEFKANIREKLKKSRLKIHTLIEDLELEPLWAEILLLLMLLRYDPTCRLKGHWIFDNGWIRCEDIYEYFSIPYDTTWKCVQRLDSLSLVEVKLDDYLPLPQCHRFRCNAGGIALLFPDFYAKHRPKLDYGSDEFDDESDEETDEEENNIPSCGCNDPKVKKTWSLEHPEETLGQVTLPEIILEQINTELVKLKHQKRLFEDWGLGRIIKYGRSIVWLFHGPPGVGKTLTAKALANHLNKPLLVVEYSELVSCWVGVTGANIASVFKYAKKQNAIILIEECEGLLRGRNEISPHCSADISLIQETNVLLGCLEKEADQFVILTTNLSCSLDPALTRRLSCSIQFPFPDYSARLKTWQTHLPPGLPLSEDIFLGELARVPLTGGEMKNIVINAASKALLRVDNGEDEEINREDFDFAITNELAKRSAVDLEWPEKDTDDHPAQETLGKWGL